MSWLERGRWFPKFLQLPSPRPQLNETSNHMMYAYGTFMWLVLYEVIHLEGNSVPLSFWLIRFEVEAVH